MIGKWALEGPGASARRNVRYLLGYSLGRDKGASRAAYWALIDEAIARPDRGANTVWEPIAGDGIRPGAIYVHGVTSLATADLEMQLIADANPRLKRAATMHLMLSHPADEGAILTNAVLIQAAVSVLNKLGLGDHQYVLAVHRDTPHPHVHAAIGTVNPSSLRVWDNLGDQYHLSFALRETEIALGLKHDNGAAVAFEFNGHEFVRWATPAEKKTWGQEEREQRLEAKVRRYLSDHLSFETPESWARDRVGGKIAMYLRKAQERGVPFRAADVHLAAAERGARIESLADDRVRIVIMERVPEDELAAQRAAAVQRNPSLQKLDSLGDPIDVFVPAQREAARVDLSIHELLGMSEDEANEPPLAAQVAFMRTLDGAEESEARFIEQIRSDPSIVSQELIAAGKGVFSRSEIAEFVAARVTDPQTVSDFCDLIETHDPTLTRASESGEIRMLSANTEHLAYTTKEQLALQERVQEHLTALMSAADEYSDQGALERALQRFEKRGLIETLDREQRQLVDGLLRRWTWCDGKPGSGKTVAMAVACLYADESGRPIVGLAVTDRAARELQNATGIPSMNLALALTREARGRPAIPKRAIVVVDETSQPSYQQLEQLLAICRERECSGISVGGSTQLGSISAGFAHGTAMRISKKEQAFTALTTVRRQRGDLAWLAHNDASGEKGLVYKMDEAILAGDREGVSDCVLDLVSHGVTTACPDRDSVIASAVDYYLAAEQRGERAGILTGDNLTADHVNAEILRRLGLAGTGQSFQTREHGQRELARGARIVFLKNKIIGGIRISNGDTGTIADVSHDAPSGKWAVRVDLDDGRTVSFNPSKMKEWNLGFALTVFKAQGSSFAHVAGVLDRSVEPRLLHTMVSRAREGLQIFYSEGVFESPEQLAESVGNRLKPQLDALQIDELERITGGPDTIFAQRIRRAASDKADPLHIRHRADNNDRLAEYARRTSGIDEKYAGLFAGADDSERSRLRHELRSAKARLNKRYAPLLFVQWLAQEREAIEREAAREQQMREFRYRHSVEQTITQEPKEPTLRRKPTMRTPQEPKIEQPTLRFDGM